MSIASRLTLIAAGAAVTVGTIVVGTTMGECHPDEIALCQAEKHQQLVTMLPRALFVYALAVCAVLLWPHLLRWPRK